MGGRESRSGCSWVRRPTSIVHRATIWQQEPRHYQDNIASPAVIGRDREKEGRSFERHAWFFNQVIVKYLRVKSMCALLAVSG